MQSQVSTRSRSSDTSASTSCAGKFSVGLPVSHNFVESTEQLPTQKISEIGMLYQAYMENRGKKETNGTRVRTAPDGPRNARNRKDVIFSEREKNLDMV